MSCWELSAVPPGTDTESCYDWYVINKKNTRKNEDAILKTKNRDLKSKRGYFVYQKKRMICVRQVRVDEIT